MERFQCRSRPLAEVRAGGLNGAKVLGSRHFKYELGEQAEDVKVGYTGNRSVT